MRTGKYADEAVRHATQQMHLFQQPSSASTERSKQHVTQYSRDTSRTLPPAIARFIRHRVRSIQEVRTHLLSRCYSPQETDETIRICQQGGWLDDAAATKLWAEHWARQGYAWRAIREKLRARGLGEDTIAVVAKTVGAQVQDEARARQLIAASRIKAADATLRSQLARRLASRGFEAELIERILNETTQTRSSLDDQE